jgi:glycosyltransferase involved in cell wall biosynthesis
LITETEDSAMRLAKLIKKPILVQPNTYSQAFSEFSFQEFIPRKISSPRLLCLSANYPHKNLRVLLEVARTLKHDFKFKCIFYLSISPFVEEFEDVKDYFVFLGPVDHYSIPKLYDESDFIILPTLLECYSAVFAESMISGRILLTSNLSFCSSICKDGSYYFDPLNPHSIANSIYEISGSVQVQKDLLLNQKRLAAELPHPSERGYFYLKCLNS